MKMKQLPNAQLQKLGSKLCKFSYKEIESQLTGLNLSSNSLIELMNHRSRKVGDIAYEILNRQGGATLAVVGAVLSNRFTHRDAKVRATNFLAGQGRACPEALAGYVHLLSDRSEDVVGNALFGIVFFQDQTQIEKLACRRDALPAGVKVRNRFDVAIRALREGDPFLFSPGFHDANDVWGLDRDRFGKRIGRLQ
jgi:hypothetical protein